MENGTERLVARREVQRCLGIGHSKFFEMVGSGRLKAVRLDGRVMIREADLKAFMEALPPAREVRDERAA